MAELSKEISNYFWNAIIRKSRFQILIKIYPKINSRKFISVGMKKGFWIENLHLNYIFQAEESFSILHILFKCNFLMTFFIFEAIRFVIASQMISFPYTFGNCQIFRYFKIKYFNLTFAFSKKWEDNLSTLKMHFLSKKYLPNIICMLVFK